MTAAALTVFMQRLRDRAQLRDISAHSLRRFFETALEAGGVHPKWIDRIIEHRVVASRGSYSKPTDTQLRDAYIQAYDFLRVEEPAFDNERIQRLEEERQQEHVERQRLAERVLRIVDDNLSMKERILQLEQELYSETENQRIVIQFFNERVLTKVKMGYTETSNDPRLEAMEMASTEEIE